MRIRLSSKQFDYLNQNWHKENKNSNLEQFCKVKTEKVVVIEIDNEMAALIYDWSNKQLCLKGFDDNYELNSEGEILEYISDLFLIK